MKYSDIKYIPNLSLRQSEMSAYEALPTQDKASILPLISIRPWATAKKLQSAVDRVVKSTGGLPWVADVDESCLTSNVEFNLTGKYPREAFYQIRDCLDPERGYSQWYSLIESIEGVIPTLRITKPSLIPDQMEHIERIGRGFFVRIDIKKTSDQEYRELINFLSVIDCSGAVVVLDYGDLPRGTVPDSLIRGAVDKLNYANDSLAGVILSISSSSFPYEFKDIVDGEQTIYERFFYHKVQHDLSFGLIYSDRASTREFSLSGGAGLPPPRIDYPLRDEWKFKRKTIERNDEKEDAYISIAKELVAEEYWQKNVRLWGVQQIEMTADGDKFGVTSAPRATAVRINIHLHTQLHYDISDLSSVDTDEDWID